MDTNERTAGTPKDGLPVPTRISLLWIVIMFNMVFADILSFMYPGALKEVLTGYAGSIHVTPGFLLGAAVLVEIPMAMIVLSRVLKRWANRWANIVAAVVTIAFVHRRRFAQPDPLPLLCGDRGRVRLADRLVGVDVARV